MADLAKLAVEVTGKGIAKVKSDLDGLSKSSQKADKQNSALAKSSRAAAQGVGSLSTAFGLVAGSAFVSYMANAADTITLVENKLKLVTSSSDELASVQDKLFQSSQRTYSAFSDTANLYSRLARSTKEFGYSQQETLKATEAIQQAFIVSGASAQEASAAVIQLGQGLASGALRGDELRSVLEQAPRLARALADGLGVSVGKLREMGAEGELTTQRVFDALLKQSQNINSEFEKMAPTMRQSFSTLTNSITMAIGELDEVSGTSDFISKVFLGWSALIDSASGSASRFDTELQAARVSASTIRKDLEAMSGIRIAVQPIVGPGGEIDLVKEFEASQEKISNLNQDVSAFISQRMDPLSKKVALINKDYDEMIKKIRDAKTVTSGEYDLIQRIEVARRSEISALREKKNIVQETKEADALQAVQDKYKELTLTATEYKKYQVNQWFESKAALIGYTDELEKARQLAMKDIDEESRKESAKKQAQLQAEINRATLASEQASAYQRVEIIKAEYESKIAAAEKYGLSTVQLEAEKSLKIQAIWEADAQKHGSMVDGFVSGLDKYGESASTNFERAESAGLTMARSLESGLSSFFDVTGKGWEDWGNTATKIIQDVINAAMQAAVVAPISDALVSGISTFATSMMGGLSASTLSAGQAQGATLGPSGSTFMPRGHAKGAVFPAGDISQYSGTIVSSPTFFNGPQNKAYARGGNVMGEAGPEAILPLTRTSGGKLGVQASGSGAGGEIKVNIYNEGSPVQAESQQTPDGKGGFSIDVFLKPIKDAVATDIATNGTMLNKASKFAVGVTDGTRPGMGRGF